MSALIEQEHQNDKEVYKDDNDNDSNSDFININTLTKAEPRLLSTTRLGMRRLESALNTHQPGTLLPHLYQTYPFSRQHNNKDISGDV